MKGMIIIRRLQNVVSLAIILTIIGLFAYGIAMALDGYNYFQKWEIANNTGSHYQGPVNIDVNAAGMIDGDYINDDATDVMFTYLGGTEHFTAMDLTSGSATWRLSHKSIGAGATITDIMWFGYPGDITRNQSWVAAGSDTMTITNSGTSFFFSGTECFTILCQVTPATYPGTRQTIFGVDNSYGLYLEPGPQFNWECIENGGSTVSATVTASINQTADLVAWHNGPGGEILLCDSYANRCARAGFTDLLTGGTVMAPITFDGVIDNLSIRSPDYPINIGTPPGGAGTPPGGSYWTYPGYADIEPADEDICLHTESWPQPVTSSQLVYLDVSEPYFWEDNTTRRYGISYPSLTGRECAWIFDGTSGTRTSYWDSDQLLSGISIELDIEITCIPSDTWVLVAPYIMDSTDTNHSYHYPYTYITHITPTDIPLLEYIVTGTRTLTPWDTSWTIADLDRCLWGVMVMPSDSSYDCSTNCSETPSYYLRDYKVRFNVAD